MVLLLHHLDIELMSYLAIFRVLNLGKQSGCQLIELGDPSERTYEALQLEVKQTL
jgi:hypothetical protein